MSRAIKILLGVVVLAGILQWGVPKWVGNQVAQGIQREDKGSRPTVSIAAVPFWILLNGKFQQVTVSAAHVALGSLVAQKILLTWDNGQISVPDLEKNRVKILQQGSIAATVAISQNELSHLVAAQTPIQDPKISITPSGVGLTGWVTVAGLRLPLQAQGQLILNVHHQTIMYHPTSVDGMDVPVLTNIQVFAMHQITLPVAMTMQSLTLKTHHLVVKAHST
ncbi:MAG: DUF2993 domain-containing protein [Firmicutes bacterium]|nr:DUF2993 domain-containing protein [Bacillota bacterium]